MIFGRIIFKIAKQIITESKELFTGVKSQRIHGDFHKGNIILRGDESYFVDFDDMVTGLWFKMPGLYARGMMNSL